MARDKDGDEGGYTTPEGGAEEAGFKRPDEPEKDRRETDDKSWPPRNMETKVPRASGRK